MSKKLSTEQVARMWNFPIDELQRLCGMTEQELHEWLHTTPEGRQYLIQRED